MLSINDNWCEIEYKREESKDKQKEDMRNELKKEIKNELKNEIDNYINKINKLEERLKKTEENIRDMQTEHLKAINKILETEISLERTKNLLVRNNIPFPFSIPFRDKIGDKISDKKL